MTLPPLRTGRRELQQDVDRPDRLYMEAPGVHGIAARLLAIQAVNFARLRAPKLSGGSSRRLQPVSGPGYFGIRWLDDYVWMQEIGIRPFTMRSLAGRLVPMWIDDPTGEERRRNPRARTRTTESGRAQVLIFRWVGRRPLRPGSEAHWPGQPGRISFREAARPLTRPGRVGGRIAPPFNVGVWWRHPGLSPRSFLWQALIEVAWQNGVEPGVVHATNQRWR